MLSNVGWPWLLVSGAIGTIVGLVLCRFFPSALRKPPNYRFNAIAGIISGAGLSTAVSFTAGNPFVAFAGGLIGAYVTSMVPMIKPSSTPEVEDQKLREASFNRVLFRQDWDARPRFEKETEGLFVGRRELIDRLTSDFISKRSGTILISGVRGVGKTALVERALLEARNKLQNRYWKRAKIGLDTARFWQPVDVQIRQVLFELAADSASGLNALSDYLSLKEAAKQYAQRRSRFFSRWFALTDLQIRRMHEASRAQLFVLKFNASDIGGALTDATESNGNSGKPHINPDKLLKALIRKLYMTCHSSKPTPESQILRWSLTDKKERDDFFYRLESAYIKSISKAYKETFSDVVNEATKRSKNISWEAKLSLEKILIIAACVGIGLYAAWKGWTRAWLPLESAIVGGIPAAIAGYLTLLLTIKGSWQKDSDRARQAQLSYEHDYSLAQMENDLEKLVSALHMDESAKFDRNRCFTRTVIVFDELDKLEDPIAQLNDVITHFKNFFTLSDALFVFITDHEFYEHLCWEGAKALLERHYSPEHTFFTQKIYLRKPEFSHFQETIYRFCEPKGLEERIKSPVVDTDLTDYLAQQKLEFFQTVDGLPPPTIAHLFIHRQRYPTEQMQAIELAFQNSGGWNNAITVAQVWASQVASVLDGPKLKETVKAFQDANGWSSVDAVAFLQHRRTLFGRQDRRRIERAYKDLNQPSLRDYVSVDNVPFTLSDLARALCFQTRNHYFDLYYMVYDYVGSYADSAPVLHIESERFTHEQRLWSRYQQLVETAFYHRREGHPSREYFNALLMESLYSVFDSRSTRGSVKLRDIMFRPPILNGSNAPKPDHGASKASPAPWMTGSYFLSVQSGVPAVAAVPSTVNAGSTNRVASFITPRDTQLINEAIVRLLRLAEARKAVSVPPELSTNLKADDLKIDELLDLTFTWNSDCEPVITQEGIDLESYESDLIGFWDQHKKDLEALDQELDKLWANRIPPEDSSAPQTRQLIADLRSMADGLRRRIVTISRADASALKTNIGKPDSWPNLLISSLFERINQDVDADVLLAANVKAGPTDPNFKTVFESKRSEVETIMRLPLSMVVFPQESKSLIYILKGPVSSEVDEKAVQEIIRTSDVNLLWCFPGKTRAALKNYPASVRFYFPPPSQDSIVKCWSDYILVTGGMRVKEILQGLKGKDDRTLVLRAGAELLGPFTGPSDALTVLTQTGVKDAISSIQQLPEEFKNQSPAWRTYQIDPAKPSSALDKIAKVIAARCAKDVTRSFDLEEVIKHVLHQVDAGEAAKLEVEVFSQRLASIPRVQLARLLLQQILNRFLQARLKQVAITDTGFQEALGKHFVPFMVQALEDTATANNVELGSVPSSLTEWVTDFEQQRLALKSTVRRSVPS